ncbi:hypothetical protein AYB33_07390 [Leptospira santarosai]|nr:hypothetical protein AYB33_07390 [Leptospira santarosai]
MARFWDKLFIENKSYFNYLKVVRDRFTQNYITGCPKFCFKTEIGLKMNGIYSVETSKNNV